MSLFEFKLVYHKVGTKNQLMDFNGIPNMEWWEFLTTPVAGFLQKKTPRTNCGFANIDKSLASYWQFAAVELNENTESSMALQRYKDIKATILLDIHRECNDWIRETGALATGTALFKAHKSCLPWVTFLMRNVRLCADFLTGDKVKAPTAGHLRWKMLKQDIHKLGMLKKGTKPLKTLDSHYWSEANLGGSNPEHFKGDSLQDEWQKSDEKYLFAFTRKNVNDIKAYKVHYVKKEDLWKYQVVVQGGKLCSITAPATKFGALKLAPITCKGWLFIVLRNGNLYASMGQEKGDDDMHFHHSSIPAGGAVIMAGAIDVEKGQLMIIDGCSGHYKPKTAHIVNALEVLEEHGVDLTKTQIDVFERVQFGTEWTIVPKRFKNRADLKLYAKEQKKDK